MAHYTEPPSVQLHGRIGTWLRRPLPHKLRSLTAKTAAFMSWIEDQLFEKWHGLDCSGFIDRHELETGYASSLTHSRAYQAVTCVAIRELLDEAKKTGIVFDHFIDLGSGKGKACFYAAARYRFRRIIGVEFSAPLVRAADSNIRKFGADHICFVNADAATFTLPAGDNLVYLFNPFDEAILLEFLENNIDKFRQSRSVIAYANDKHRLCLAKAGFVTLFRNQDSQSSLHQYPFN
jgi:SAM-dependent methyltransferase